VYWKYLFLDNSKYFEEKKSFYQIVFSFFYLNINCVQKCLVCIRPNNVLISSLIPGQTDERIQRGKQQLLARTKGCWNFLLWPIGKPSNNVIHTFGLLALHSVQKIVAPCRQYGSALGRRTGMAFLTACCFFNRLKPYFNFFFWICIIYEGPRWIFQMKIPLGFYNYISEFLHVTCRLNLFCREVFGRQFLFYFRGRIFSHAGY